MKYRISTKPECPIANVKIGRFPFSPGGTVVDLSAQDLTEIIEKARPRWLRVSEGTGKIRGIASLHEDLNGICDGDVNLLSVLSIERVEP